VRRRVIARDSFACQLCGRRVEVNTAHVHHLSYDTYNLIGYSLPAECVTLCRSCHDRIESAKQAA
jgi:5-methylcytosine-specific restriction endonuclease McrA